jgi:hypothetical protein
MRIGLLILLLLAAMGAPAHALQFSAEVLTREARREGDPDRRLQFRASGFYTAWENPFQVRVTRFSELLGREVTRSFRVVAGTPVSPLIEGVYVVKRGWKVGFWYNPIRGEQLRKTVQIADGFEPLNLERDTDLADVHLIHIGRRGLVGQLGYYRERGRVRDRNNGTRSDYSLQSWNVWLSQRIDTLVRHRLLIKRPSAQVMPFVSVGYHPASGMNHAVSVLAGFTIVSRQRFGLSATAWLFDVADPDHTATRITVGLSYEE